MPLVFALIAASSATAHAARITYVENDCSGIGEVCEALGYPVPLPIASQTPVAGFRRYDELIAGLMDLGAVSGLATAQLIGETIYGRDIWAFRLGDADTTTAEGLPEGGYLQNGTIHAREWASPEVVAAVAERLLDNRGDDGLHDYLLENVNLTLIPVLNVDGFLQTQRFPHQAQQSTFIVEDGTPDNPRDGRMRRKNLRCDDANCEMGRVDELLATLDDFLFGVDPNRNNPPGFDSGNQNSDDPRSLIFHGPAAASEREIQALQQAAAGVHRLRLYVDTHSFTRSFLAANTGNARRNAVQQTLAERMRAVTGFRYGYGASPANYRIGSTDEFFSAPPFQVPAYTLEIEPTPNGATDYGGNGVIGDGFVLPEAEIVRVRNELADAILLGVYRQVGGPPSLRKVDIRPVASGDASFGFTADWAASANARGLGHGGTGVLQTETDYRLWLAFNKPMRHRDGDGNLIQYPGQNVPLAPTLVLEGVAADNSTFTLTINGGASGWLANPGGAPNGYLGYRDDAYAVNFRLPANTPLAGVKRLTLAVTAADLSGQNLDANPATFADWTNGAWAGYEDSNGVAGDVGGTDRRVRIVDDGAPFPGFGNGDDGGGAIGWLLLVLFFAVGLRSGAVLRTTTGSNLHEND